jgi:Fe-S cluster biosynthesis and repair protein YggX
MTAQKLSSLEDSEKKLNAELEANSEKAGVANLLLQDCNNKLSEAVSRSNWDEAKVVQIMLDAATKDSMKITEDRLRIQKERDEVIEKQKAIAASSGSTSSVKRDHPKSTEKEATSKSTAKRMKRATGKDQLEHSATATASHNKTKSTTVVKK